MTKKIVTMAAVALMAGGMALAKPPGGGGGGGEGGRERPQRGEGERRERPSPDQLFDRADADKNGSLSREEFVKFLESHRPPRPPGPPRREGDGDGDQQRRPRPPREE